MYLSPWRVKACYDERNTFFVKDLAHKNKKIWKELSHYAYFAQRFWFFSGCAKDEEDVTGSIYGIVSDAATGEPVSSANVSLSPSGKSVVTGNDGRYEFPGLTPGQYTVQVTKNEYESNTKQITVVAGEQATGDITLQQASSHWN